MVQHYKVKIEQGGAIIGVRVFSVVTYFDNTKDPNYVAGTQFSGGAGGESLTAINGKIQEKIPDI